MKLGKWGENYGNNKGHTKQHKSVDDGNLSKISNFFTFFDTQLHPTLEKKGPRGVHDDPPSGQPPAGQLSVSGQ